MAHPPRNILTNMLRNFLNSFRPRYSKPVLMGEDNLGNKYFESTPTSIAKRQKPSRYYLPASGEEDFHQKLPAEWEAWLRGRRKQAPTREEIAKNDALAALKKENAKRLEAERAETKTVNVFKESTGPASFPNYGDDFELRPGSKPSDK